MTSEEMERPVEKTEPITSAYEREELSARKPAIQRIIKLVKRYGDSRNESDRAALLDEIKDICDSLMIFYCTDDEFCRILGVSPATAYSWRKKRLITYCQLTSKHVGYLPEHILQFLESRKVRRDGRKFR